MSNERPAILTNAVIVLMDEAEDSGIPLVAVDVAGHVENVYRLAVSMTGRKKDVKEVVDLMRRKYPNAGIVDMDNVDEEASEHGFDAVTKESD